MLGGRDGKGTMAGCRGSLRILFNLGGGGTLKRGGRGRLAWLGVCRLGGGYFWEERRWDCLVGGVDPFKVGVWVR